jgi:uncharacterized membrane protein
MEVPTMAEFPVPDTSRPAVDPSNLPTGWALAVYVLYAIAAVTTLASAGIAQAPLLGLVGIIGLIIAHVKRDDARGSWLESHFRWLIRTFWFGLLWSVIGWVFAITVVLFMVALAIWGLVSLWILYRVIRGFLRFNAREPMPV